MSIRVDAAGWYSAAIKQTGLSVDTFAKFEYGSIKFLWTRSALLCIPAGQI